MNALPAAPGAATPLHPHQPASGMRGLPRFPPLRCLAGLPESARGDGGRRTPSLGPALPASGHNRLPSLVPRPPRHCAPSPQSPRVDRSFPQPPRPDGSPGPRRPNCSARPSPSMPLCAPLAGRPRGHSGRAGRARPAYLGRAPSAASVPRWRAQPAGLGGAFIAATSSLGPAPPPPPPARSHLESG